MDKELNEDDNHSPNNNTENKSTSRTIIPTIRKDTHFHFISSTQFLPPSLENGHIAPFITKDILI